MGEFGDFFAALARHAPEDADALCEARSRLERQRITSLPRLAGLSDAQWQRIDVEIGVEALIRNTLEELLEEEKTKTGGQQEPVNETETSTTTSLSTCRHARSSTMQQAMRPVGVAGGRGASTLHQHQVRQETRAAPSTSGASRLSAMVSASSSLQMEMEMQEMHGPCRASGELRRRGPGAHEVGGPLHISHDSTSSPIASASSTYSNKQLYGRRPPTLLTSDDPWDIDHGNAALLNRNVAKEVPSAASSAPSLTFEPPENLEELWENLLLETLPPDKRQTLQEQWEETESRDDKFMMLLEYNSYLRRPEISPEERAERRKQLEPLLAHYGIPASDENDDGGMSSLLGGGSDNSDGMPATAFPSDDFGSGKNACSSSLSRHNSPGSYSGRNTTSENFLVRNFAYLLLTCLGFLIASLLHYFYFGLDDRHQTLGAGGSRGAAQLIPGSQGVHEEQL